MTEALPLTESEAVQVAAFGLDHPEYEYGFYDSHPDGNWRDEPKPQTNPQIWWYVFDLPFTSVESAERSGAKSVWGHSIIVRRVKGETAWEHAGVSADV